MELNILKESNDTLQIEIIGETHTFCNLLRNELFNVEGVNFASYNIKHPTASNPIFSVNVSEGKPKKLVFEGGNKIKDKTKEFRALLKKL